MNASSPTPAPGDRLLRYSRRATIAAGVLCVPTVAGAFLLLPLWRAIAGLSGIAFAVSAGLFGLALAALPLSVIVALCISAFARVESLARHRIAPINLADRILVGLAVLLSAIPALWPASKAVRAVVDGSITIKQPVEHSFTVMSDPLVFWENVGYWVLAALALSGLAAYYWHNRWRAIRRQRAHSVATR